MPTYTYRCNNKDCKEYKKQFQVKQKMSDDKLIHCDSCDSDTLARVIVNSLVKPKQYNHGWTDK